MNILFVHEADLLNKVVFEIHNLAEILSKNHIVFAIDYEENWKRENIFDFGTLRTREIKNINRAYNRKGFTLRRPGIIKFPLVSRLSAFFTHYCEIEKIIENEKIDAIILYSAPTNGLQTISLAKKHNIPVIFRSIDILNRLVPNWFLRVPTRIFEKKVYENVDKIVAITPKLSDYVINLGASKDKVELLFTGVDTNQFNPKVDSTKLRKELNLGNDCKVIVFIGTLFEFCGMDQYIEQFPEILKEFPQTKLIVVGGGFLHEKLKKLVRNLQLEDSVILTGFRPYQMMPQYINLADICINPFHINDTTRDIMPGKTLQYLACGKPLIATPLPGMKAVIPGEERGVIYSEINKFGISTIELLKDEKRMKTAGDNGFLYVKENHEWNEITQRLEETLINAVNHREAGTL
jgi:glycosyltransferase involved in cell wall biosynthesis